MIFYKPTARHNPKHKLPTVMWDPERDRALFAFAKGPSGALEFETEDPEAIRVLTEMGYDTDIGLGIKKTENVMGPSTAAPPPTRPVVDVDATPAPQARMAPPIEMPEELKAPPPQPVKMPYPAKKAVKK